MNIKKESEKNLPESEQRGVWETPPIVDWDDEKEFYEERREFFIATVFLCISLLLAVIAASFL